MGTNLERTTAEQHTRSLAKLLFYINPECCSLSSVLKTKKMGEYLDELEQCGVGPYGQRSKVDACVQVIRYFKLEQDASTAADLDRAQTTLDSFKKRLRKEEKVQENLRREEEGSCEAVGSMIDEKLANPALTLWAERILLVCDLDPALLTDEDKAFASQYILAWLTLDNSQRPGPAIDMTIREFEQRRLDRKTGSTIVMVEKHKTAIAGSAQVVIDSKEILHFIIECWLKHIRPALDRGAPNLLLKSNGDPITSQTASREIERLGESVALWLPTPKMGRKLTSTAAADQGEDVERMAAKHMAHTVGTSRKNYQGVCASRPDKVASRHAALKAARQAAKRLEPSEEVAPAAKRPTSSRAPEPIARAPHSPAPEPERHSPEPAPHSPSPAPALPSPAPAQQLTISSGEDDEPSTSRPPAPTLFFKQPVRLVVTARKARFCPDMQTIVCRDVEIFLFFLTTTGACGCVYFCQIFEHNDWSGDEKEEDDDQHSVHLRHKRSNSACAGTAGDTFGNCRRVGRGLKRHSPHRAASWRREGLLVGLFVLIFFCRHKFFFISKRHFPLLLMEAAAAREARAKRVLRPIGIAGTFAPLALRMLALLSTWQEVTELWQS